MGKPIIIKKKNYKFEFQHKNLIKNETQTE